MYNTCAPKILEQNALVLQNLAQMCTVEPPLTDMSRRQTTPISGHLVVVRQPHANTTLVSHMRTFLLSGFFPGPNCVRF